MICRSVVLIAATVASALAADIRVVEEIAAKVNGDIITRSDLEQFRKDRANELQAQGLKGAQLTDELKHAEADALRDQIDERLLVQRAKDLNINVDPDVSKEMARLRVRAKIIDEDQFAKAIMEQYGVTLDEFKERMKNNLLAQRVISAEVGQRINIPEADARKYYEEHKEEFVRQEQVFLSQILISTEGKNPDEIAAAEKKAKELATRARQGEKFSELASNNSDDPNSAKSGGFLGSYVRSDLREEIADKVFSQKKGYVTDPIKIDTPPGYLILKVEERYEAGQASFEDVKDEIINTLAEPKMTPKLRAFLTRLRQQAFLEIRDGYVDSAAAPGKDTTWKDVARITPQTTTKEEVAAQRRKKFLGLIPYGRVGPAKPEEGQKQQPAPAQAPPVAK
jgi:parvulin-like peptidyl-prolyl isomerase